MMPTKGLPATLTDYGLIKRHSGAFPVRRILSRMGGGMTIGIGAIAHNGSCVIMAADTRGTYDSSSRLSPHERIGKQFALPFNLCANIAGTVTVCQSIVSELHSRISELEKLEAVHLDHIRNAITESQVSELFYRVDRELIKKLALRITDWRSLDHTRTIYKQARKIINRTTLEMELMVGGFVHGSLMLLVAMYNEAAEMEGSHATIGSGYFEALEALNARKQNHQWSWQRTVVHVQEALDAAKAAHGDIGNPSDFNIITPKWVRRLPSAVAKDLAAFYQGKDTEPLDDDFSVFNQLRSTLYETGISRVDYAAGKRLLSETSTPSVSQRSVQARSSYDAKYPRKDHFSFDD